MLDQPVPRKVIGQFSAEGGEQQERQQEDPGRGGNQFFASEPGQFGNAVGDQDDQRVTEDVVVVGPGQLGEEERAEPPCQ